MKLMLVHGYMKTDWAEGVSIVHSDFWIYAKSESPLGGSAWMAECAAPVRGNKHKDSFFFFFALCYYSGINTCIPAGTLW